MDLQIRVRKQVLTCRQTAISNSVNFIKASFMFDAEWDGTEKHVIFSNGDIPSKEVVLDSSMTCIVPWEVLEQEGSLYISVVGILEDKRITTKLMENPIEVYASGELGGSAPQQPSPSPWDYYNGQLEEIRTDMSGTTLEYVGVNPEISSSLTVSSGVRYYVATLLFHVELASLHITAESGTVEIEPSRSNIPPVSAYIDADGQLQRILEADMLEEIFMLDASKIDPEASEIEGISASDYQIIVEESGGTLRRVISFDSSMESRLVLLYRYVANFTDASTRDAFINEFLLLIKQSFIKFQSTYKKKAVPKLVVSEALT